MPEMRTVDSRLCNGCGLCVAVCVCKGWMLVDDVAAVVESEECVYCTQCEAVCPTGAISCPYEIVITEYYEYRETIIE